MHSTQLTRLMILDKRKRMRSGTFSFLWWYQNQSWRKIFGTEKVSWKKLPKKSCTRSRKYFIWRLSVLSLRGLKSHCTILTRRNAVDQPSVGWCFFLLTSHFWYWPAICGMVMVTSSDSNYFPRIFFIGLISFASPQDDCWESCAWKRLKLPDWLKDANFHRKSRMFFG